MFDEGRASLARERQWTRAAPAPPDRIGPQRGGGFSRWGENVTDAPGKNRRSRSQGGYIRCFLEYFGTEPVRYLRLGAPSGPVTIRSSRRRSLRGQPARDRPGPDETPPDVESRSG